ncbi:hypothetical protein MHU86_18932 [Fragilaria crotonensis]|nr:hypothetical protein MHU86_18932 [Fragilaria crotonensis]
MLSISWLSLCMMIVCLADATDGAGTREFRESGLRRMFAWNRRLSSNESETSVVLGDGDNDHADTPAAVAVGDNQNHDNIMVHNNHHATTKSPLPPPPLSRQPKEQEQKQQQTSIFPHINNEIANRLQLMHRAVRRTAAGAISTFSFVASVSMGLTTSAKSRFREIRPAIDTIQIYLEESGISKELAKSFTNRLFQNVVVLWRIQKAYRETHDLRDLVAMKRNQDEIPSMEEASRYIRFATAAYGEHMIRAARLTRQASRSKKRLRTTRQRISEHIHVPEEDIMIMDIDFSGHRQHLHHIVAKDHVNKVVVLAIRGTFSIRDLIVDANAFTQRILGRKVKCFAYGCPPVFNAVELVPDAVASTTCYIHGNDGVPFLSLGHVRRLVSTLQWIDQESSKPLQKAKLLIGKKGRDKRMINAALQGSTIVPKKGSPILVVPASAVVWTRENEMGRFDFKVCDPRQVALLGIQISAGFMGDHALASYEEALHYLENQGAL